VAHDRNIRSYIGISTRRCINNNAMAVTFGSKPEVHDFPFLHQRRVSNCSIRAVSRARGETFQESLDKNSLIAINVSLIRVS